MKSLVFFALLSLAAAASERYKVKVYKDYNALPLAELEGILDCMVYDLNCTPVSEAYRAACPEVIRNACEYCTDEQKRGAYQFYSRIPKDLPKKYQDLRKKYDPENKYYDNFYRVLEQSVQNENKV